MRFFPYENFFIITPLKPLQVQERLRRVVEPSQDYIFNGKVTSSAYGAYFSGDVGNETFELRQIISYRNSFLPVITGTTESYISGSRVSVKMKLDIFMFVIMGVALFISGLFSLAFLYVDLTEKKIEIVTAIPFGVFVYIYALVTISFKAESVNAKNTLLRITDGEINLSAK